VKVRSNALFKHVPDTFKAVFVKALTDRLFKRLSNCQAPTKKSIRSLHMKLVC